MTNELAKWMIANSYATGHGDTVDDLARQLVWQVAEECAKICTADETYISDTYDECDPCGSCAAAIRAKFCEKGE